MQPYFSIGNVPEIFLPLKWCCLGRNKRLNRKPTLLPTYEALLQPNGQLQFLDGPTTAARTPRRVLVTFTDEVVQTDTALCGAALSEPALSTDWLRDEEDAAWPHLLAGK
jgi:hypothetical protein